MREECSTNISCPFTDRYSKQSENVPFNSFIKEVSDKIGMLDDYESVKFCNVHIPIAYFIQKESSP